MPWQNPEARLLLVISVAKEKLCLGITFVGLGLRRGRIKILDRPRESEHRNATRKKPTTKIPLIQLSIS